MRCLWIFLLCLSFLPSMAQRHWSFEFNLGVAGNVPLPLRIEQKGYPDIYIPRARFYSESLVMPVYWDWRFTKHLGKHAVEFEAIHHKIYLKDSHPDIQRFGISHGFNILTFNYARRFRYFIFRNGLGSVLMHPESTIRNKVYPEGPGFDIKGYVLRGVVYNTAIAKQIPFFRNRMFINTELKATFAKANAPIVDGVARVNNIAFQGLLGLGVNFAGLHRKKAE